MNNDGDPVDVHVGVPKQARPVIGAQLSAGRPLVDEIAKEAFLFLRLAQANGDETVSQGLSRILPQNDSLGAGIGMGVSESLVESGRFLLKELDSDGWLGINGPTELGSHVEQLSLNLSALGDEFPDVEPLLDQVSNTLPDLGIDTIRFFRAAGFSGLVA